jgi:acyl-CoA thioester hydrolase
LLIFKTPAMPAATTTVHIAVRYNECDPMGVTHHSVYAVWLEEARSQWLRNLGVAYSELEKQGVFFVVAKINIRYHRPARYDDELTVTCSMLTRSKVSLEHEYVVQRGDELMATGQTTLVCVDGDGQMQPVPDAIPR